VRHIILYDAFALQTRRSRARFFAVRLRNHGFSPASLGLYLRRAGGALVTLPMRLRLLLWRTRAEHTAPSNDQPTLAQLAGRFAELAQSGVRVTVLHSGADFSNVNYDGQIAEVFGSGVVPATGLRTGLLAPIDHIMTSTNAQQAFIDWVCHDVLERPIVAAVPSGAWPLQIAAANLHAAD
jgi:hypothetical protein